MVAAMDIPLTWDDLTDKNGQALSIGAPVQFALGSKLKEGVCIKPKWVEVKIKNDDEGADDAGVDVRVVTKPGVLIYNDEAAVRKTVARACDDVCLLTP